MSQPPRKRLRKGTRSCLECRQRKVRCTFERGDGKLSCDGCIDRRIACVGQENAPNLDRSDETVRDRLRRLEATVESLNSTVVWLRGIEEARSSVNITLDASPADNSHTIGGSINDHVEHSDTGRGDDDENEEDDANMPCTEPAYVKSLFNNHLISSAAADVPDAIHLPATESGTNVRETRVRDALSCLVPSKDDVVTVTTAAVDWWSIHNSVHPSLSIDSRQCLIDKHGQLHSPSARPASIAMWLVCFSMALLQLPQDFNPAVLQSINSPRDFLQRTVKRVDQLLTSDSHMRNLEGIECAVVFSKLTIFLGRPKTGWLVLRRAIAFGQLLNMHESTRALKQFQTQQNLPAATVAHLQVKAALWEFIGTQDRWLSLLLHLPAATSSSPLPMEGHLYDPNATPHQIMCAQSDIANRLCHRDQLEDEHDAYEETRKIIHDLHVIDKNLPMDWWGIEHSAVYDIPTAASVVFHMSHRYLVIRAQLPYLLKANDDALYEPNAIACTQACREFLRGYIVVRTCLAAGVFLSRTVEIQAFLACVVLLLHRDRLPLAEDRQSDAALLENAKAAIEKAPVGITGSYTTQIVSALNKIQRCLDGAADSTRVVQLNVPLLGTIFVRRSSPEVQSSTEQGAISSAVLPSTVMSDLSDQDETFWDFPLDMNLLEELFF